MTNRYCPGCGHEVDNANVPCPHCAYKRDPEFGKKLVQFSILFGFLGLLWILFLTKDFWTG